MIKQNQIRSKTLIFIVLMTIVIRITVALNSSLTQSEVNKISRDEIKVIDENRKLKEAAYGNSIINLEEKAEEFSYSYPEKIFYLKTPAGIAGLQ